MTWRDTKSHERTAGKSLTQKDREPKYLRSKKEADGRTSSVVGKEPGVVKVVACGRIVGAGVC